MNAQRPNSLAHHPSVATGLLWGLFSATAMFSAFVLPTHIAHAANMRLDAWYFKLYFAAVFFAALYHGFYRLKTILKDLKILK